MADARWRVPDGVLVSIGLLPSRPGRVRIEVEIPEHQYDEFQRMFAELAGGKRPRMELLEHDIARTTARAMTALEVIAAAINDHPGTGQARRIVRFVAGCYNGAEHPFDLTDLRGLDTALANACLDYLNYDRLGLREVHHHLPGGAGVLRRWLMDYGMQSRGDPDSPDSSHPG